MATSGHCRIRKAGQGIREDVGGRVFARLPECHQRRAVVFPIVSRLVSDEIFQVGADAIADTVMPGVVRLSCGAWYDPADDGDASLCLHGNANVGHLQARPRAKLGHRAGRGRALHRTAQAGARIHAAAGRGHRPRRTSQRALSRPFQYARGEAAFAHFPQQKTLIPGLLNQLYYFRAWLIEGVVDRDVRRRSRVRRVDN